MAREYDGVKVNRTGFNPSKTYKICVGLKLLEFTYVPKCKSVGRVENILRRHLENNLTHTSTINFLVGMNV